MNVPIVLPFLIVVGIIVWLAWIAGTWIYTKIFGKVEREAQLRMLRMHDIQDDITSNVEFFVHNRECVCGEGYVIMISMRDVKKFNDAYMDKLQKSARRGY